MQVKKILHTSNVLQPSSFLELQPSKTMFEHPQTQWRSCFTSLIEEIAM